MATFDRKDDYNFIRWAAAVKKKDHYTCQICGQRGELNSHHLNAWNAYPDERYDIDNGITLCRFHHEDFHAKFGKGDNTKEQFEMYAKFCEALIRAANKKFDVEQERSKIILNMKDGYEKASTL